ncbi:MDR family MFS transporter [Mumia flava]|uniref:MDR family MFS transporter n=1 Tax=Mumia flava TaxID=1348852 RepID=UPI000B1A132D|nr:MDR family MFS transporter [Mumia flava]
MSATTAPPSGEQQLSHRAILEVMVGLLAALFTAILASTIVSNALPTIIGELNGTQSQYTWVVTAALLAMTVSTPVWSKLADLLNKKVLVQIAIVTFVVGSTIAGFAQNVETLLAARAIQGLAMGGLTALTQAIIGSIVTPRERGRYSGYLGGTMAVATVSGPLVGGIIVDTDWLGWRWTFFVCVPFAVVSLVLLQRYLRIETLKRDVKVDYAGAILVAIAASLPLLWVTFAGDTYAWLSWQTAAFWAGTAIAVAALIRVETRVDEPLVPLKVFRDRTTTLAIVASMAVGIAMFGSSVFLGQYLQVAQGHTPTEAGLLMIPLMGGSLVGTLVSGQLITRYGRWKRFLVAGSVLLISGLLVLGTIDHDTSQIVIDTGMAAVGLGMGMMLQNLVLAVQNTVDVTEIGVTSGAVAFFRSLGGTIGVSVLGAILATGVQDRIASGLAKLGVDPGAAASAGGTLDFDAMPAPIATLVRTSYGDATAEIFAIAAGVAVVALIAVLLIKEVPLRTTIRKQEPAELAEEGQPEPSTV